MDKLKRRNTTCMYHYYSGAGSHCILKKDTSGYHEYYRTECYGRLDNPFCLLKEKEYSKYLIKK